MNDNFYGVYNRTECNFLINQILNKTEITLKRWLESISPPLIEVLILSGTADTTGIPRIHKLNVL